MAFEVVRAQPAVAEAEPDDASGPADDPAGAEPVAGRPDDGAPTPLSTVPARGDSPGSEGRPSRSPRGRAKLSDVSARSPASSTDGASAGSGDTGEGSAEVLAFKSPTARRGRRPGSPGRADRPGDAPEGVEGAVDGPNDASPAAATRKEGADRQRGDAGVDPSANRGTTRSSADGAADAADGMSHADDLSTDRPTAHAPPLPTHADGVAGDAGGALVAPGVGASPSNGGGADGPAPDGSGGGGKPHLTRIK